MKIETKEESQEERRRFIAAFKNLHKGLNLDGTPMSAVAMADASNELRRANCERLRRMSRPADLDSRRW